MYVVTHNTQALKSIQWIQYDAQFFRAEDVSVIYHI